MGGVLAGKHIYNAFMNGPEHVIELFHGYTYTGHPMAAAAALATLETYMEEGLFERARTLEGRWADAVMSLKGHPMIADIRTIGITAGFDIVPLPGVPGKRAYDMMETGFHDHGLMVRVSGDTIALSPPLIVSVDQIGEIVDKLARMLEAVD
jgi:beta-alanine--pyruvate transaminase